MPIVRNPKVNGIYYVYNRNLGIKDSNGRKLTSGGHSVIVTSINKKKGTARVKTITSVIQHNDTTKFNNTKLSDVEKGNLLIIPNKKLGAIHLSAISHEGHTINLNNLLTSTMGFKFPNRYKNLINRK